MRGRPARRCLGHQLSQILPRIFRRSPVLRLLTCWPACYAARNDIARMIGFQSDRMQVLNRGTRQAPAKQEPRQTSCSSRIFSSRSSLRGHTTGNPFDPFGDTPLRLSLRGHTTAFIPSGTHHCVVYGVFRSASTGRWAASGDHNASAFAPLGLGMSVRPSGTHQCDWVLCPQCCRPL